MTGKKGADGSFDFLIVGAGLSGLVMAEQLSSAGFSCAIVEKRNHIGGNCFDFIDPAGVLVHRYGPHFFHTNSHRVIDYLSQFTAWNETRFTVKAFTRNRYWSFPINLNTFEELQGRKVKQKDFAAWLAKVRKPAINPANAEEAALFLMGRELYEMFFKGYTKKQWGRNPNKLDPSIIRRIPIRINRDDRYHKDKFQALPARGYAAMFEYMLETCRGVTLFLETPFEEAKKRFKWKHLIFTGPIDEFYQRSRGALDYRSLFFELESHSGKELAEREAISGRPGLWQPCAQVNYPDEDVPYTRSVEIKHVTKQEIDATTIVREYPQPWDPCLEPYYPRHCASSRARYKEYEVLARRDPDVTFMGRLGRYRYYDMDEVVKAALKMAQKLVWRFGEKDKTTLW